MKNSLGQISAEGCVALLQRNWWKIGKYTGHKQSWGVGHGADK